MKNPNPKPVACSGTNRIYVIRTPAWGGWTRGLSGIPALKPYGQGVKDYFPDLEKFRDRVGKDKKGGKLLNPTNQIQRTNPNEPTPTNQPQRTNPMKSRIPSTARLSFALATALAALLTITSAQAQSTYTWANSNVTGTPSSPLDWFSDGDNTQATWSTSPGTQGSSLITNTDTVQFFENTTTALTNTAVPSDQTSNINNGGTAVELGTLTLSGLASATTSANLTMTLSGDPLNFSAATGTINLAALNATRTITYNLDSNIQLGTASSAGALTLTGNGTSAFNIGGIISELQTGGGSLIKSGSSTATLTGANSYTGGTVIDGGRLQFNAGALPATGQVTVNSGGVLAATGAYATAGAWLDSAVITTDSTGVLGLIANNGANVDFTGYDNLYLGATGAYTFGNFTLTPGANGYLLGGGGGTLTFGNAGKLVAGNNLTVRGNVTLSTANSAFNGTVTVNAGTLALGNTGALGSPSSITLAGGTALTVSVNGLVIGAPITLGASGTTAQINSPVTTDHTLTLNGAIGGDGNLTLNTQAGGNNKPIIVLGGQSTYGGDTLFTINNGGGNAGNLYVQLAVADALPTTTVLTLDGGNGAGTGRTIYLNLDGHDQTLGGLKNVVRNVRNQQIRNISATAATLTINNSADNTFSGTINDNLALTKGGAGTLTLSGANTYTGATLVSEGTLALVGGSQASEITVDGGSLGFTLDSPTTSSAALALTSGTVEITGSVDNASDYLLMTATDITGTPTLASPIANYTLQKTDGDTKLQLVYNPGGSPYDTWINGFDWSGYTSPDLTATGNPDGDTFTNLQEFAFAFNPTVSDGVAPLAISGGTITQNGPPQIHVDSVTGQYFLRYTRRADFVAAGLTYTAQFAADSLGSGAFEGVTGGSVVATGTGAGGVAIEAVAIEYPDALPISGKKARFGRVAVSQTP